MQTKHTTLDFMIELFHKLIDVIFIFDAILMIAVLPFYFDEGYRHIGTDKSVFFRTWSVRIGMLLFPMLILFFLLKLLQLILNLRQYRNSAPLSKPPRNRNRILTCFGLLCKKLSVIDLFAFGYGVSVILSYCLSDYKESALWGSPGWFMGLLPQLIFVTLYFGISRLELRFRGIKLTQILFYLFFPVSAIVFVLGILDRYEIRLLQMEYANPSFISTIGNINWYCGYIVPILFAGVGLFWLTSVQKTGNIETHSFQVQKISLLSLSLFLFVGFATLLTQGSSSGIFALTVILFTLALLTAMTCTGGFAFLRIALLLSGAAVMHRLICVRYPNRISFTDSFILLFTDTRISYVIFICLILVYATLYFFRASGRHLSPNFFHKLAVISLLTVCIGFLSAIWLLIYNTIYPGNLGFLSNNPLFTFHDGWASNRGATWSISWQCYKEQNLLHQLFGLGPDCLWEGIAHGSPELQNRCSELFANARLTNSHNEWLTTLINNGIIGVVCYAGMFLSSFLQFCRSPKNKIPFACGIGILAYTAGSMFSFQQVLGAVTVFLLLGIGRNLQENK